MRLEPDQKRSWTGTGQGTQARTSEWTAVRVQGPWGRQLPTPAVLGAAGSEEDALEGLLAFLDSSSGEGEHLRFQC